MAVAPLLWINAFPGSGKLTVAKALAELLGEGKAIIIDNHQLIDPVELVYPREHPEYQQQRKRKREEVFRKTVGNEEYQCQMIIFTDFQSYNELGMSVAKEYQAAAHGSGRSFVPICLTCQTDENVRRLASAQRAKVSLNKLQDKDLLQRMRSRCKLYDFGLEEFTIDVTHLQPTEAAERILSLIEEKGFYDQS